MFGLFLHIGDVRTSGRREIESSPAMFYQRTNAMEWIFTSVMCEQEVKNYLCCDFTLVICGDALDRNLHRIAHR